MTRYNCKFEFSEKTHDFCAPATPKPIITAKNNFCQFLPPNYSTPLAKTPIKHAFCSAAEFLPRGVYTLKGIYTPPRMRVAQRASRGRNPGGEKRTFARAMASKEGI